MKKISIDDEMNTTGGKYLTDKKFYQKKIKGRETMQ